MTINLTITRDSSPHPLTIERSDGLAHDLHPGATYNVAVWEGVSLAIHEPLAIHGDIEAHELRFFAYNHLPPHLQAVSRPFYELARGLLRQFTPAPSPEVNYMLRALLEAKDCAVRCAIDQAKLKQ